MTIGAVAVAILVLARIPWLYVAVAAVSIVSPIAGVAALAGVLGVRLLWERIAAPQPSTVEVEFLRSLAATLSAGSTFRAALAASTGPIIDDRTRRMCEAGVPLGVIIPTVSERLGESGASFAVLAEASESSGSAVVEACHVLVEEAEAARALKGETRVAVAQARFSSLVVGVVPLLLALALVALRGIPEPGGAGIVIPMIIGGALMAVGTAVVLVSSQKAVT